jgi:hypothetical protein
MPKFRKTQKTCKIDILALFRWSGLFCKITKSDQMAQDLEVKRPTGARLLSRRGKMAGISVYLGCKVFDFFSPVSKGIIAHL